jgi:hypothetical protein
VLGSRAAASLVLAFLLLLLSSVCKNSFTPSHVPFQRYAAVGDQCGSEQQKADAKSKSEIWLEEKK